jgi:hypothetical protein
VLLGKLKLEEEQKLVNETHDWLQQQQAASPAYAHYLSHWGSWNPPVDV